VDIIGHKKLLERISKLQPETVYTIISTSHWNSCRIWAKWKEIIQTM